MVIVGMYGSGLWVDLTAKVGWLGLRDGGHLPLRLHPSALT